MSCLINGYIRNICSNLLSFNLFGSASIVENQLWATRIYIVLLIACVITISLKTSFEQQTILISVQYPNEEEFNRLHIQYSTTLTCPCSRTSVEYKNFITFSVQYHQLCHSYFVSPTWSMALMNAYGDMWINPGAVLLGTHSAILFYLCNQTDVIVYLAVNDFLSRKIINIEAMPQSLFESQLNSYIERFLQETSTNFRQTLAYITDTFRINQFQHKFMSSWLTTLSTEQELFVLNSIPLAYVNDSVECVCAHSLAPCSTPIIFTNSSGYRFYANGLMESCLPIDGVRSSTLECFFDRECVDLLANMTQFFNNALIPTLESSELIRFTKETPLNTIIDELFIESWHSSLNYSDYFVKCAPKTCQYSLVQSNNTVEVVVTLIGLYGGLVFSLRIIVWYGLVLSRSLIARIHPM